MSSQKKPDLSKLTRSYYEDLIGRIGSSVQKSLEIGCDPGTWTDICLRNTKHMTKLTKERFAGENIDFYCGDFLSSNIVFPATFNVIFSARALEYMNNKKAMIEKNAILLMPGGLHVIFTKNPACRNKKWKQKGEEDIQKEWISHQNLKKLYGSSGLENIVTYPICLGSYYPPFNNRLAIMLWNVLQEKCYRKAISPTLDSFSEGYMTLGRRIGIS